MRIKTIGVMGSGKDHWSDLAEPLGRWIAAAGYNILTGGGQGVMLAVTRAFCSVPGRVGRSIAIIPTRADPLSGFVPLDGYPNPYVDVPIITPLPRREPDASPDTLSRNHVNILSSDVVIALPGGPGTVDEISLAQRFQRPFACFGPEQEFRAMEYGGYCLSSLDQVKTFIDATFAKAH
jgi:uncharacterized protein (TIGR00725 family)